MDTKFEAAGNREAMGERAAFKALLANDPFRNLFYAGLTSSLGDWVGVLAILALTESILGPTRAASFAISGVMIARVLPTLVLGPVAGVFVDRWNRRTLMVITDLARAGVMALVPFSQDVLALFLATLAVETMTTLFIPAKDAVIPQIVPRRALVQANQLNLGAGYGTLPLGGVLFALLVGASTTLFDVPFLAERPAALAIWFNSATFLLSAFFVWRLPDLTPLRRDRRDDVDAPGAIEEMKEGFRFIATQPLVRSLVLGIMTAAGAAGVVIANGEAFAGVVGAGSSGFGVLVAVVGTGLVIGLVASGPLTRRFGKARLFAPGIGLAGVGLMTAAFMPRLDLAAIPTTFMGFGAGVAFLSGYTLLQETTSDAVRGRTFAAFNTGVRAALFAALVGGPVMVGLIGREATGAYSIGGVRITMALAGLLAVAGGLLTSRSVGAVRSSEGGLQLGISNLTTMGTLPGMFISFEGGEGAGKSTQIELLQRAIAATGRDVVVTREPGGTVIGERVRQIVLDPASTEMSDRAEALLYAAARAQHVEEVIAPALEKGAVVLCDRFVDSSVVYQGIGRGLGNEQIAELNRWGTAEIMPDLVVVLDIDAVEGLRRAGSSPDRLESAGTDFHRGVNAAFLRLAEQNPERYVVIDGSGEVAGVQARIRNVVLARLG